MVVCCFVQLSVHKDLCQLKTLGYETGRGELLEGTKEVSILPDDDWPSRQISNNR